MKKSANTSFQDGDAEIIFAMINIAKAKQIKSLKKLKVEMQERFIHATQEQMNRCAQFIKKRLQDV